MSYNTKNYTEQGGAVTHIGGKLVIDEGGSIEGLPSTPAPTLPIAENQIDSTANTIADLRADFNSLLAKLKDAGLMSITKTTTDDE